ncbi:MULTISPECIES: hypothetical protein [unclassified Pseudarthrobacter]|uniref:hypothetical protein n=1 Tax=unclassified Pseudarthrobacter TaxID=2647000 RepID=UPI0014850EDF|nr:MULTISPECIES: hypothetical protein [unclassified Pseudarthrobacter]
MMSRAGIGFTDAASRTPLGGTWLWHFEQRVSEHPAGLHGLPHPTAGANLEVST